MPVHDWSRVDAGTFHAFHNSWLTHLQETLNGGLLPPDYYALTDQQTGAAIADVLTLESPRGPAPQARDPGGVAVAEAPPLAGRRLTGPRRRRPRPRHRALVVRHVSGHRLVALLEVVSPANKDRAASVAQFVAKAVHALDRGVHLLIADLWPPGRYDRGGLHGALWHELYGGRRAAVPADAPLTLASYAAAEPLEVYLNHLAVGAALPDMPLFLTPERYVRVPLESTYQQAYHGMPAFWRNVLEGPGRP